MKKLILKLLCIAFFTFPILVNAQTSSIEDLYNKYAGQEGFTSVNISKEMFKLLVQFQDFADDEESKIIMNAIGNLNGLKIITQESSDGEKSDNFKRDIDKVLSEGNFVDLMTVREEGEEAKFLLRKKGDNIIELLLVATENNQKTLISFFGLIDLETIALLSKTVNMKGMPSLDQLEEKYKNKNK